MQISVTLGKRYNDYYGHQKGDDSLRLIARTIEKVAKRPADLVARYGGEEFVVILPNTPNQGALFIADTILKEIIKLKIPHEKSDAAPVVSLSLGVTSALPEKNTDPTQLSQTADAALYEAKKRGRNQAALKQG